MAPVIYADTLFLFNFLMDSVILIITSRIINSGTGAVKIAVGSAMGGVYAVFMFFPKLEIFYTLLLKISVLFGIFYMVFGGKNFRQVLKGFSVFLLVNIVLGGGLLALIFLTDFGTAVNSVVSGNGIYMNLSPLILLFGIAGTYIFLGIYQKMSKRVLYEKSLIKRIKIEYKGKTAELDAFIDTGCRLLDPITDKPAVICEYERLKLILGDKERAIAKGCGDIENVYSIGMRVLPFATIGGDNMIFGIVADRIWGEGFEDEKVTVGLLTDRKLGKAYGGIINPELLLRNSNTEGLIL